MDKTMLDRIIILGHKGFIGKQMERHLRQILPGIEIIGKNLPEVDLTQKDNVMTMAELFDSRTAVILLAAKKRQFGDTLDAFNQNLQIATNVSSLVQQRPVGRFVFFSSSAVYGEDVHNTGIIEETPVYPTSYYGLAKFTSERLFWKVLQQRQDSLVIVRPPTIYGPGDQGETYGPVKFANAMVKNEVVTLWGDGSERREFIYIDDIVEIIQRLLFSSFHGVVNIASATSYSFRDVIDVLESVSGRKLFLTSRPRSKARVDNAFLNDRLLEIIGPYSFTSLSEGIKSVYDHLLNPSQEKGAKNAGILQT